MIVDPTDELVIAAQRGDEEALQELLRRCGPQLRRYAMSTCASDDVEEAVQDALWLLYRRVGALRAIGALSGWLFQIVRRECLRRARKRREFIELDSCDVASLGQMPAEELRIDLMAAICSLPQRYREILILRDIGGYSSEEAAISLAIPVTAAKSRLHRARQMVRSQLRGSTTAVCR
jgi:RNA polymerase sigma factor (sigma-70 family)